MVDDWRYLASEVEREQQTAAAAAPHHIIDAASAARRAAQKGTPLKRSMLGTAE